MRRLTLILAVALVFGGCGSDSDDPPDASATTTAADDPAPSITELPIVTEFDALGVARATWAANRPDEYRFTYTMDCPDSCVEHGPWRVTVLEEDRDDGPADPSFDGPHGPFPTIEAILNDIGDTISDEDAPVTVTYNEQYGYPTRYVNDDESAFVDGGFVLVITEFDTDPPA